MSASGSRISQVLNVPRGYASSLRLLRPCWKAMLSILSKGILVAPYTPLLGVQ